MIRIIKNIAILFFAIVPGILFSQTKIQVVTKTISRVYKCDASSAVVINGEKSDIIIEGWNNQEIKIDIQLISKNTDKETARKDLNIINLTLDQKKNEIIMSDNFRKAGNEEISSNLSIKYIIKLPVKCHLKINNLYGNIKLENLSISGEVSNSFGEVTMKDISGDFSVHLNYSNINTVRLNGTLKCKSESSDLDLNDISGNLDITANYGKIIIGACNGIKKIDINASRTVVEIQVASFEAFNYSLSTLGDEINLPVSFKNEIKKESGLRKFNHAFTNHAIINVKTSYCPITIKIK